MVDPMGGSPGGGTTRRQSRKLAIDLGVMEEVERMAVALDSRRPAINNDG